MPSRRTDVAFIIVLLFLGSANSLKETKRLSANFVRGTYHAWWIIAGVFKEDAEKMLHEYGDSKDLKLLNKTLADFPENQHPIMFEIGKEFNCGPAISPALRSDFLEFKFEIPFVTSTKSNEPTLNYKQRLYESTELNSVSSNIMYGLKATKAQMNVSDSSYTIKAKEGQLAASFSSKDYPLWFNAKNYELLKPYRDIMNLTWFGNPSLRVCAKHNYDFDTALIRPAAAEVTYNRDVINKFIPWQFFEVTHLSVENIFGAVQIKVNFTMTLPEKCLE